MRKLLRWSGVVAAYLLCVLAFNAYAQSGGSATRPLFVRKWQGDTRDFKEVTCGSSTTTELVSASEIANAMSIYFYNTDAAGQQTVTLCPRAAYSGSCDEATEGISLAPVTGFTSDVSVAGPWSCMATGGTAVVEVYIERDYGSSLAATPTPQAPTPTPTPTPTPA